MPPLTAIFWNEAEARLRAGWRIGLQLAAYLYGPLLLNRWLGGALTLLGVLIIGLRKPEAQKAGVVL